MNKPLSVFSSVLSMILLIICVYLIESSIKNNQIKKTNYCLNGAKPMHEIINTTVIDSCKDQ